MFRTAPTHRTHIERPAAPSPRSIADSTPLITRNTVEMYMGMAYSMHSPIVSPAPNSIRTGSAVARRSTVRTADIARASMMPCEAMLLAADLWFAPILRDMADDIPMPSPFPIPMTAMYIGETNPTAAIGPAPSPETQRLSTRLLSCCIRIAMNSGIDKAAMPFL